MKPNATLFCACLFSGLALSGQTRSHSVNNTVLIRQTGSYLGVATLEVDADRAKALKLREERGVEIKVVEENSPASRAGLKPEDVLLEYNGQRIEGCLELVRMVSETPVGRKVTLGLVRNGAPLTVTAVLAARSGGQVWIGGMSPELPPMPPMPPPVEMPDLPRANLFWRMAVLGIEAESLNSQMAGFFGVKQGVLVRMVNRESAAQRAGLKAGDVIVKAAGKPVAATREISSLLKDRKEIALSIVRDHKDVTVNVLLN